MKAETLKKSILQYAMQGKLVEQDPNDEPACELLKRIKAEKEQLIKEGKIKKEKPLPPITQDEIPYELPQGWEWVRLGEIISISSGKFLPTNEMNQNGSIPVYGGNGINGYHDNYLIDKPTLIIGRVGFYCGCVHLSTGKAWVTDNAFIVSFSENNININFLKLLLVASDLGKNDNATAQPVVSGKKIYPIVVALPPLAEQLRIVEKLEQILPLVEEYGKNEEKLSELNKTLPVKIKQSVLQHAIQGKLVPQNPTDEPAIELLKRIKAEKEQLIKDGKIKKEKPLPPITKDEIPYELPQGWEWVRLGEIGDWGSGATPNKARFDYYRNGTINWLKTGDLNDGYINEISEKITELALKETSVKIKPAGSLLVAMYGATIGKLGILNVPSTTNQACCACIKFADINVKYLFYYLLSERDNLRKQGEGGAQPNISREKIIAYLLPLPPLAEQQRIVKKVEELMTVIEKLKV